ncbi:hypothetical protein C671_3488 [[Clostridium] bifermentans ATCC 19299]|uniref:hypothetical protein n=1 Tax=Paraclostridium bifermentans TaxID=1490 RepID=UPI00038C6C27|nr:hypothetical protein [Paraclostridium bifermentans]EQK37964.1 hypothetical protein C671_3488 [[Clostridium] bifermentans ATCC 19299] [Paraclostridium bifermentans ATCC 19299]
MDVYDVLEKYDKYDEVEREFKRRTAKDRGATNLELKFKISSEFLDKKWREFRDKRSELVKGKGKCIEFERVSKIERFLHSECSFINAYPREICEPCSFYQDSIKPIDEAMDELRKASKIFIEKSQNERFCN